MRIMTFTFNQCIFMVIVVAITFTIGFFVGWCSIKYDIVQKNKKIDELQGKLAEMTTALTTSTKNNIERQTIIDDLHKYIDEMF